VALDEELGTFRKIAVPFLQVQTAQVHLILGLTDDEDEGNATFEVSGTALPTTQHRTPDD